MPPFGRVTNRVGVLFRGEESEVRDGNTERLLGIDAESSLRDYEGC